MIKPVKSQTVQGREVLFSREALKREKPAVSSIHIGDIAFSIFRYI
jgi:hypothetical protein